MDALVVGEALVDIVTAPAGSSEHVGGGPANIAIGLGRRGVDTTLLTQLGDDERGRRIRAHVAASHVRLISPVLLARTSTARAAIEENGSATYAFDVAWERFDAPAITPRIVHVGSIAAFASPGSESVLALVDQVPAAEITFDPNIRPALVGDRAQAVRMFERMARRASVVKLSEEDAAWLFPGRGAAELAAGLIAGGVRLVAITLGADGAILTTARDTVRVPPVRVDVADTIGAGDTFMASIIRSLLDAPSSGITRSEIERMGSDAVSASAVTVSRSGADLPWAHELAPGA